MTRIMITLQPDERAALLDLAERERRDPRDQAALFIRSGLQHLGLLPTDNAPTVTAQPSQAGQHGNQ